MGDETPEKQLKKPIFQWLHETELVIIIYTPIMMLCQTLLHYYVDSRIGEMFQLKQNSAISSICNSPKVYLEIEHKVQHLTVLWVTDMLAVESFLNVFTIYLIYLISGVHGRKTGMLVSLTGTVIKVIIIIATITLKLPLQVLFVASIISGITGGSGSFMTCAVSHITDTNTDRMSCVSGINECSCKRFKKALYYAIIVTCLFTIFFGSIMKIFGYLTSSVFLLGWVVFSICIIIFLLKKAPPKLSGCQCLRMKSSFLEFWEISHIKKRLLVYFFLSEIPVSYTPVLGQTFFLTHILMNKPFCSSTFMIGTNLAFFLFPFFMKHQYIRQLYARGFTTLMIDFGQYILAYLSSATLTLMKKMNVFHQTVMWNTLAVYTILDVNDRAMFRHISADLHGDLYALLLTLNAVGTTIMIPLLNLIYFKYSMFHPCAVFIPYTILFAIGICLQLIRSIKARNR